DFLGMTKNDFVQQHTRLAHYRTGLSLNDRHDGACYFLSGENVCQIYPVRPDQCKGFPNNWRFPGFEEKCPAIPIRFHIRRWATMMQAPPAYSPLDLIPGPVLPEDCEC